MLNGPIQGGIYPELREISATEMAKYSFAVHPIGGIVPLWSSNATEIMRR